MKNIQNIKRLLFIILIFIPLVITPWAGDYFYYPKLLMVQVITLGILAIHLLSDQRKKINIDIPGYFLLAYLFWVILSTFFSVNPIQSVWGKYLREEGLFAIGTYILLYFFAKTYYKHDKKIMVYFTITATIVSTYGIMQYFGYDPIPRDFIRMFWSGRAFSTMGNPNFLGSYLVLIIPFPMFYYIKSGEKKLLGMASIIFLCLLITFTRSALIGFLVILSGQSIYFLRKRNYWSRFSILIILFFLISVAVNIESNGRLYGRFLSIGQDAQALIEREEGYERGGANRIYIWSRTYELVQESPWFGYGLENLDLVFVEKYEEEMKEIFNRVYAVDRAHNEFLHIAVSSGIPSMIFYMFFLCTSLIMGYKNMKADSNYVPYYIAIWGYIAQGFFNISIVAIVYIFWIFLGVVTSENIFNDEKISGTEFAG